MDAEGIAAVGFTGSTGGGRALFDRAARRPRPIPVYAEMGSVNPGVVTAAALRARADAIRDALLNSITFAAGQLCTKPGVVFVPAGAAGDAFVAGVVSALEATDPPVMLNDRLLHGFDAGLGELAAEAGTEVLTPDAGAAAPGFRHAPVAVVGGRDGGGGSRGAARGALRAAVVASAQLAGRATRSWCSPTTPSSTCPR